MKLLPFPFPVLGLTSVVEGLKLSLLRRGRGSTNAQFGSKVPATLEFHWAPFPSIRDQNPSIEKFAWLDGELELRGLSRKPVFLNGPDAEALPNRIQYVTPLTPEVRPADRARPRRKSLHLDFDSDSFEGMDDVEFSNSHLILPELPEDTLFIEISAVLMVNGSKEAETDVNDRLDVIVFGGVGAQVPPTSFGFELRTSGGRIPSAPVKFRVHDAEANAHEGETNLEGQGFVDGVKPGQCELELLEVAPGDWGAEVKAGAASSNHSSSENEDLATIAAKKGFQHPATIYEFEDNENLREERPNWNQLVPGDSIALPPTEAEPVPRDTGQLHRFELTERPVEQLRLQIQVDAPFTYELTAGSATFRGRHEGSAIIEHEVSARATKGQLKLSIGERSPFIERQWELSLAALEPVSTVKGQQARLMNLGFDPQGVDGNVGKKTRAAIEAFQRFCGFEPTGEMDDETQAELEKRHDQKAPEGGHQSAATEPATEGSDSSSESASVA